MRKPVSTGSGSAPAADAPCRSPRAELILDAAESLVAKQGFKGVTMATVAERAHVGKGTAYQYWRTKEDLFLELFSRHLAGMLTDLATRVRVDPSLARPEQLCPAVVASLMDQPLVWALQIADGDVLGSLLDDPRMRSLLEEHGANPLLHDLVPLWQQHGASRDDWPQDQQADAIALLLLGYVTALSQWPMTQVRMPPGAPLPVTDHEQTLRRALATLVEAPTSADIGADALADAVATMLEKHASQVVGTR